MVNATPQALYPQKTPDTRCTGSYVGTGFDLDGCGKFRVHRYFFSFPFHSLCTFIARDVISLVPQHTRHKACRRRNFLFIFSFNLFVFYSYLFLCLDPPGIRTRNPSKRSTTLNRTATGTFQPVASLNTD